MTARTALVVGASRGIGLGLAHELGRRGWRVIATVRDPAQAGALGEGIRVETVDIADAASSAGLAERLSREAIDLLVVNAGVNTPRHQSVERATEEELGALIMTNAVGPVRLARLLLPAIAEGGTIAFMSSRMGSIAENSGGEDLYRMSKSALNMLGKSLAAGIGAGSRVLLLHPGWVRTDMGGSHAPLSVEESARGLADVLERGEGVPEFVDHRGEALPW